MEGFGLGGPWASLQDFSVGPALLLLLVFNSLVVGGGMQGMEILSPPRLCS